MRLNARIWDCLCTLVLAASPLLLFFTASPLLIFFTASPLWANPDIVIGLDPNIDSAAKIKELEGELTKRLNEKVIIFVGKNYEELRVAFEKGELNFAILPPRLAVKV